MAARQRVLGAQPPFLCPQSLGEAACRGQVTAKRVGNRGECRGLSMSSGQGGHKKHGSPGGGSPDPALPGSLLASLKLGSSSLGEGPPRLLSGDVGVVGLVGAWLGRGPSRSSQASQGCVHPVRAPFPHLSPDCGGREKSARLKGATEIAAVQSVTEAPARGPAPAV